MFFIIFGLASLGFLMSLYGYRVEQELKSYAHFKPACDISDSVSCSKAFNSKYNKLFGVSNTLTGMIFYAVIMMLAACDYAYLIFVASLASVGMSIIFAYLLYFKIKSICIVCTSVYVINILLLILSWSSIS